MNLPKVAVITPGSFVIPSGRSSSVERVIEKIVPYAAASLDIRIYGRTGEDGSLKAMVGPVPCFRVPGGSAYLPSVLRHLRSWRPDVIDVHNRPLLASRLKAKLPQAQVLLSLHSTAFIQGRNFPETGGRRILSILDGIVVNSGFLQQELLRRYPGLDIPVYVNHLGVSLEDFVPRWTPTGEALRRARLAEFGWEGRKVVLFLGRLIPEKGVHVLLKAAPSVIREFPEALFLIVGSAFYGSPRETSYVRELKELAEAFPNRVVFFPFTPYPHVADWYNVADVVVVPSGDEEAFGLVNLEAMAAGVPVIASRTGGIPEIIKDGHTGVLLPADRLERDLAQSISCLFGDEAKRREMGLAGAETARRLFRWQHTASRWSALMERLADESREDGAGSNFISV